MTVGLAFLPYSSTFKEQLPTGTKSETDMLWLVLYLFGGAAGLCADNTSDLVVQISDGCIHGTVMDVVSAYTSELEAETLPPYQIINGTRVFRGIPYAVSPPFPTHSHQYHQLHRRTTSSLLCLSALAFDDCVGIYCSLCRFCAFENRHRLWATCGGAQRTQ